MLIDKMENRIAVGILAFVGVMVLVGWVAINENARMADFERQFEARSIERGAELFAANCSTCHGLDGRGLAARAPGLNSPHYFGYDYFAPIDNRLLALQSEEQGLLAQRAELTDELVAEGTSAERSEEIQAEIVAITNQLTGEGGIEAQRETLQQERLALAEQLEPAVANNYPLEITEDDTVNVTSSRTAQVEWGGTLEQYTITTLNHGRPGSNDLWDGNAMVAWAQRGGGPLRDDQIQDLTNYILNWDKGDDWTIQDATLVNQYARIPVDSAALAGAGMEMAEPAGVDAEAILAAIDAEGITGDAARGQLLYENAERSELNSALGCSSCHYNGVNGPAFEGTWERTVNERLTLDQFEGYSPEQYLVESIVVTGAYIAPGWSDGIMPANFSERMSVQDLADVVAYLETTAGE